MGQYTSCSRGCGRHAYWWIELDHEKLDKLTMTMDPKNPTNIIVELHQKFDKAAQLAKQIEQIIGNVKIFQSGQMKMRSFLCKTCFKAIDLNSLPEEWGYESHYSRSGYYHK